MQRSVALKRSLRFLRETDLLALIAGKYPRTVNKLVGPARFFLGASLLFMIYGWTGSQSLKADTSIGNVAAGTEPLAAAVNSVTNKIYVANYSSGSVTVIDGANNTTTMVATGTQPRAVAVNPVTNKIYVANFGSANVTVIDGTNNSTVTVAAGTQPNAVALNPVTNK